MDMVLSPLVDACIGKVADFTAEKVGMILGVKDELTRLQRRLQRLRNFLEDAEKKSIQDTSIRSWLGELKDIVYDAEDILDLCRVHPTRLLEEDLDQRPPSTPGPSVRTPCFPLISCFTGARFRHEMAEKIKKLNNMLLEIERDSSVLSKLSSIKPAESTAVGRHADHQRQTTSQLVESEVVGQHMEEATKLLVEWLVNEEDKRKCSVFGVVGMGGIGKTTLARKVYNHASINQHFPTRIWVCISQTYSETDLLKQIIRGAGVSYKEASTIAELAPILTSALSRNFFLVLDDVWRADVWETLLQTPLACVVGAKGRVLITSRREDIAKEMMAKAVYNVKKMNSSDGWMLLSKKVFGDYGEEEELLGLENIGIEIVNKCDGLPLAIEVIGGVLRTKESTRSEWEKILRSNVWSMDMGRLRGALYLSYEDLPAHLKQCFLYCSLYPEDASIRREDLIHYWVAEGFIRSVDGEDARILMEDTADDYYLELVKRSLLHASDSYECHMHDMLRSLAQFLIGDESVCLVGPDLTTLNANTNLRKLRRLSLATTEEVVMPNFETMREPLKHLRTLLFHRGYNWSMLSANGHHLFETLGRLRVLNLGGMKIESLPDSLGNLVHLRLLRLDSTRISELPDSIQNLVNLQYLSLSWCRNLHTLPKGITKLYNLRYLSIRSTPLIRMPTGFDRMEQLNHLSGYSVGDETVEGQSGEGCNIDELRNLSHLRLLHIKNLCRATTGTPAITKKPFLREMSLEFYDSGYSASMSEEVDIQRMEKVLEELFPPPSIQVLNVVNYPGRAYPSWLSTPSSLITSFPLLETIVLSCCGSLTQLPSLGQLPQLKVLSIDYAHEIVKLGPEFAWGHHGGSVQSAFPRLEKLRFDTMTNWEVWSLSAAGGGDDDEIRSGGGKTSKLLTMPRLKKLVLCDCSKLRTLQAGLSHFNSLESMTLFRVEEITAVNQLPRLTHLEALYCPNLQRISGLPLLRKLEIEDCTKLKDVVDVDALCFLYLLIHRTEEYFPAWLLELAATHRQKPELAHSSSSSSPAPLPVPELFRLQLHCGPALLRRCVEGGEYWPIIQQFPQVTINSYRPRMESLAYTRTPRTYTVKLAETQGSGDESDDSST